MDQKRKGEIALALLKDQANQKGFHLAGMKREIGNVAKRTGIPFAELNEFVKIIFSELIEEFLS